MVNENEDNQMSNGMEVAGSLTLVEIELASTIIEKWYGERVGTPGEFYIY